MSALFTLVLPLVPISLLTITIYRLYLHPLSSVPGPKLAAFSKLYEIYYDLYLVGQLPFHLIELHKQYGPIVRVGPNEVHISDPAFITHHFTTSPSHRRSKYPAHKWALGVPDTVMSTVDIDLHRARRNALAPFFGPRAIASYEPIINDKLEKISDMIEKAYARSDVLELRLLFWGMTTDVITSIAFPKGMGLLEAGELNPDYRAFASGGQRKLLWFKHFPVFWSILKSIPPTWLVSAVPQAKVALNWELANKEIVQKIIQEHNSNPEKFAKQVTNPGGRLVTAIDTLLVSELLPSEKTLPRICQEASSLVGAGVETLSNTLVVTLFYLYADPTTLSRLRTELIQAIPDSTQLPLLRDLQALPYLNAVMQEGLRFAVGVASRFIRIAPDEEVRYQSYSLPRGTEVSVSTIVLHRDESVFPEAQRWAPERWLARNESKDPVAGTGEKGLMISFSKGPRVCLGMSLAHAELLMALAMCVRRWDFKLVDTGREDVDIAHDSVLPMPVAGSQGVRVRAQGKVDRRTT